MIAGTIFGLVVVALLIVTGWLIQSRQDIDELEQRLDREMAEVDRLRGEAMAVLEQRPMTVREKEIAGIPTDKQLADEWLKDAATFLQQRQTPCFECGEPLIPVLKCQKCGDTVIGDEGNAILDCRMVRPTES